MLTFNEFLQITAQKGGTVNTMFEERMFALVGTLERIAGSLAAEKIPYGPDNGDRRDIILVCSLLGTARAVCRVRLGNVNASCLASAAGFLARPPYGGASRRSMLCSRASETSIISRLSPVLRICQLPKSVYGIT